MKEKISIVSATHNQRAYIKDWYEGILCQFDTLDLDKYCVEVVLVVDESGPAESWQTATMLIPDQERHQKYFEDGDNDFKVFVNSENLGGPMSFTNAISQATGDWICLLEPDDYYKPGKLSKSLKFIKDRGLDMAHGDVDCILPSGEVRLNAWSKTSNPEPLITVERLSRSNSYYTCTGVGRAELYRNCPTSLEISNKMGWLYDYASICHFVTNGAKIGYIPGDALSTYRDGIGASRNRERMVEWDGRVREWLALGCPKEWLTDGLGHS